MKLVAWILCLYPRLEDSIRGIRLFPRMRTLGYARGARRWVLTLRAVSEHALVSLKLILDARDHANHSLRRARSREAYFRWACSFGAQFRTESDRARCCESKFGRVVSTEPRGTSEMSETSRGA